MSAGVILNVVFLQVLWFAAILGAAGDWMLPALVWFGLFFCWYMLRGAMPKQDLSVIMVATPIGFVVDSLWIQLGWIEFSHALPSPMLAPYWIALLWAGLGLTLNHSFRWLHHRPGVAALLSLIAGPMSYFAASRLGAVEIIEPTRFFVSLGLSWAVVIPSLFLFTREMQRPGMLGHPR